MFKILIILNILSVVFSTIIISPSTNSSSQVNTALIFVQGAFVKAQYYIQFSNQLQQKLKGNLWVALTESPFNLPLMTNINFTVFDAIDKLKAAGFPLTANSQIFLGGHSLGGVIIQNYTLQRYTDALPVKVAGIILLASFVTRNNRNLAGNLPILTLGAELDGVNRISRIAESFYFDNLNSHSKQTTIVVEGINHYQFVGEGQPPLRIALYDIKPEVSDIVARDRITSIVNSFMQIVLGRPTHYDNELMEQNIAITKLFLQPIINALKYEGFYLFHPPCFQKSILLDSTEDNSQSTCIKGSKWVETSQNILVDVYTNLDVDDTFLQEIQFYPSFNNNCKSKRTCNLDIKTGSQLIYSVPDPAFDPVAATEIKAKMMSKQAVLFELKGKIYDFDVTDDMNTCRRINREAIRWAMATAPLKTMQRYLNFGKKLVVGEDLGPFDEQTWIGTPLSFESRNDSITQKPYVSLRSPTFKTALDAQSNGGYHYCKLLSPARAIEWLYTDSLRP